MSDAPTVGMLNPAARREDFLRMPEAKQSAIAEVLRICEKRHLSVRCEAVGDDVYVIIGRGFSSARHWLMVFGLEESLRRS